MNDARRCAVHEGRRAFCLLCAALPLSATKVRAVEAAPEQVKAAYLLKFPGFVEWPPHAFEQARSPFFVIAVAGADDVYATLHELATTNPVQGRPTRVLRLARPEPSTPTHLLFVGNDLSGQLSSWVGAYAGKPVVIVADTPNGLERGAALNFVQVGDRLRFEASPGAAERVGIRLSSRLLGVAERVLKGDAS